MVICPKCNKAFHNPRYTKNKLGQSDCFSNKKESVILIGDAAATASFLRGMGANCAIEEAMAASHLFRSELNESDFSNFNQAMKQITDRLLEDSAFLFE